MQFSSLYGINKISALGPKKHNSDLQDIRGWWNDHDAGVRNWTFMNSQKTNGVINVQGYGAKGDGSTDDSVAIQNAISAANPGDVIFFPNATYNISVALTLPKYITLIGTQPYTGFAKGTIIVQTTSNPIFNLSNTSQTGVEYQGIRIENMTLSHGSNQLYAENGGASVFLRNVTFTTYTGSGILMRGFIQNWSVRDCDFVGGNYCVYHHDTGLKTDHVTTGTPLLHDKCQYYSLNCSSQAINYIYINLPTGSGNSVTWMDLSCDDSTQDGVVLGGALANWVFIDYTGEATGNLASTATAPTTATTTSGSANVTVASGTGLVNGTVVTIAGAGTSGKDWYPTISSGGGTTSLVMTTTAPTSVTSAELVNYLYSEFLFLPGPKIMTFINFSPSPRNSSNNATRYSIDASGVGDNLTILSGGLSLIYDPNAVAIGIGATTKWPIRRTYTIGNPSVVGDGDLFTAGNLVFANSGTPVTFAPSLINAAGYVIGSVVHAITITDTTATTSSGTTFTSTATSTSITPHSTTHRVKISVTGTIQNAAAAANTSTVSIFRGSTDLSNGSGFVQNLSGTAISNDILPVAITYLDQPNSTSSLTYTVKIKSSVAGDSVWNALTGSAVILLEEIAF